MKHVNKGLLEHSLDSLNKNIIYQRNSALYHRDVASKQKVGISIYVFCPETRKLLNNFDVNSSK